ncbi:caspase family protein [Nocardia sp. CA-145437]|uniref:caspase family protein n=1 Tax=Nocardia sp. CA-145437 TaxID=3239980 RepID=UPI003D950DE8
MRYLIAAGTSSYRPDSGLPDLPLVAADVELIAEFFTSATMGYTRVLAEASTDPSAAAFEDALSDWCTGGDLDADDVIVVYYAGHGDRPTQGGPYRLSCADSLDSRPRSWLSLQNVAEVLATSPIRNVLFIIDACHAASGSIEVQRVTDGIVAARPRGDGYGSGTWVLASARHRDLADDGGFAAHLVEVCGRGDGPSQRFLAPSAVAAKISQVFAISGRRQRTACSATQQTEQPPFFPNPGYDPSAEVDPSGRLEGDCGDLLSHFEPRGRGVEHIHDPGSYFTGRGNAMTMLRSQLEGPGGGGAVVVTGAPGSGKSAVLGRIVLKGLSEVSVNARHQTLEALLARIAAGADVPATSQSALLSELASRSAPFRILIDSLDEAGPAGDKAESRRIAWELLRPLGAVPCVRLVVGSRSELLPHIGEKLRCIDLDEPEYADDTSTAEYVRLVLSDMGSPYADRPETAAAIAGEVARRAGSCFLVARMTASALLRGAPIDTEIPGWGEGLPSDVGGAFEAYLQRLPQARQPITMALLTALAFGEGHGLPRKIWIKVADRISGIALRESDIDLLVEEDGSYLTNVEVAGAKHFRLYHQVLTDHLRQRTLRHRDLRDIAECFVEVLLELTPEEDWERGLPYVRGHLATHAAAAGTIRRLVEDPAFLLAADTAGLLTAVRHGSCDPRIAMVVERCADSIGPLAPPGVDRAAQLMFAAESHGASALARRTETLSTSMRRVRIEARTVTPHRIVGRHPDGNYSTTSVSNSWMLDDLVLTDGTRAVLAGSRRFVGVHVWMVDDPARSSTLPHAREIAGVRVLPTTANQPLAMTLDIAGDLRVWDVVNQTVVHHFPATGYTQILDIARLEDGTSFALCRGPQHLAVVDPTAADKPILVVERDSDLLKGVTARLIEHGGTDIHLVLCDQQSGTVVEYTIEAEPKQTILLDNLNLPRLFDSVTTAFGATFIAVSQSEDTESGNMQLIFVNCISRQVFTTDEYDMDGYPRGGGFIHDPNYDFLFVAHSLQRIHAYSVTNGRISRQFVGRRSGSVFTLVDKTIAGAAFAFTTEILSNGVYLLNCTTGQIVGNQLIGHESAVQSLHVISSTRDGSHDVISVGNDGTARLWPWSLATATPESKLFSYAGDFSKGTTELIRGRAGVELDLVASSWHGLRLLDSRTLDKIDNENSLLTARYLQTTHRSDSAIWPGDTDGTLHVLAKEESSRYDQDRSSYLANWHWQRISRNGDITGGGEEIVATTQWKTTFHLIPPSLHYTGVRLIGFDPDAGYLLAASTPTNVIRTESPWHIDIESEIVQTASFTDRLGHAVLLIAIRQAAVRGDHTPTNFVAEDTADANNTTRGYFWNSTTGLLLSDAPIELPPRVTDVVPHHDRAGTRFIALVCADGGATVLDLDKNCNYLVHHGSQSARTWFHRQLATDHSYFIRWAEFLSGEPILVYMERAKENEDTELNPLVIWDSAHPEALGRRLPILARRLLWSGLAPSGAALLACSDEHGISLFHLPDFERVWRCPLPALITSLDLCPGSPHLDLAVATQQGVVLIRPRFSAEWERRLLTASTSPS